jgi:hypothetical protein
MSIRKIAKGIGVGILIGVPLVFAAAIFLSTAFYLALVVRGYLRML